jgi:hypothetical protein
MWTGRGACRRVSCWGKVFRRASFRWDVRGSRAAAAVGVKIMEYIGLNTSVSTRIERTCVGYGTQTEWDYF